MKTLFILPEYYPHSGGGISTYYQHYIDALKPHCDSIKVIVGSGYVQRTDKFIHNGVEVEYLNPVLYNQQLAKFTRYDLLPEYRNNIAAAWAMWEQAAAGKGFDIIECTDFGLGFAPWVIHHNKPVITRLHGSAGQIALHENDHEVGLITDANMYTELTLLPLCDGLLTHSQANHDFWLSVLPQANIKYLKPIYHFANTQPPVSLHQRDNWGLVTARVQKWKGPEVLCQAMRLVKTNVQIKWLGRDTPFSKKLSTNQYLNSQYADVWGTRILHSQPIPNNEVLTLQQQARFGIVPSLWDMFNFACLEFMAAGTPLICADGAGASELIEHGINGFKYEADNPSALADCIELVLSLNQAEHQKMGLAAQQTIASQLSANSLIAAYIEEYNRIKDTFTVKESNAILNKLYLPSAPEDSLTDILNKQPLKQIMNYVKKRVLKKLKGE